MTAIEQQQLGKTLWAIADDLRGAMNADDFRDYMLSFLFLRYLSDNYEAAAKKELGKDPIARADKFFTENPGIHKLLIVDDKDHLHGLFTMSDVERIIQERNAQFKPALETKMPGARPGIRS